MNKRVFKILVAVVAVVCIGLCARERFRTSAAPQETSQARPLGIYSPKLPDTMREQARDELARDARRREARFVEAVQPGYLFQSTRIAEHELSQRDPAELFELGAQLFNLRFRPEDGFGAKDLPRLGRVQRGGRGGPDAYRCSDCHRKGGPAGGGELVDNAYLDGDGDQPSSGLERNPISLAGAGIVEILAREMTAELARERDQLVADVKTSGERRRMELRAKGVSFGFLTGIPGGRLDTRELRGIDLDLVVKPFGWKGHAATLREVVEDELLLHHGMQSSHLAENGDPTRAGHFGAPDPDGDGVLDEISEGQLGVLTLFIAMQELPQQDSPTDPDVLPDWSEGKEMFDKLGCAGCHTPSLPLDSTVYELPSRTGGETVRVDLAKVGADPRIQRPVEGGPYQVYLFSDLKRHVVGTNLREDRRYRGVSPTEFVTPRLWGLSRSRPYLHDGGAPTIDDAILAHSGEARAVSQRYAKLSDRQRAPLRVYLVSLTRARRLVAH